MKLNWKAKKLFPHIMAVCLIGFGVAHSGGLVAVADAPVADLKPQAGEMQLDGQILMMREDHSFILDATSFTAPNGRKVEFDDPKSKNISVSESALLLRHDDPTKKVPWNEFKAGDRVSVIGSDKGGGTPLNARIVFSWRKMASDSESVGSEMINAATARLLKQAEIAQDSGKLDQAVSLCNDAIMNSGRLNDARGLASANNLLGMVYADLNQSQKAIEAFKDALQIRQSLNDAGGQALILNNLGMAYMKNDNFADAISMLEQGVKLQQEAADNQKALPILLSNLTSAYMRAKQSHQALVVIRRLAPLLRNETDATNELDILTLEAMLCLNEEPPLKDEAKAAIERAQKRLDAVPDASLKADYLIGLGNIYNELDQPEQTKILWNQALEILHQKGDAAGEERLRQKMAKLPA